MREAAGGQDELVVWLSPGAEFPAALHADWTAALENRADSARRGGVADRGCKAFLRGRMVRDLQVGRSGRQTRLLRPLSTNGSRRGVLR